VCEGDVGSDIRRSYTLTGAAAGPSVQSFEVDRVRVEGKQKGVTLFTPPP
jgi:hypothetical protein